MSAGEAANRGPLLKGLEEASRLVEEFEEFYRRAKRRATPERVREAGMTFFLSQAIRRKDRAAFKVVADLSLKVEAGRTKARELSRRLALEQRKVKLLEQRQAQAETVARSNLAPEERERRWREIFGLAAPGESDKPDKSDRAE